MRFYYDGVRERKNSASAATLLPPVLVYIIYSFEHASNRVGGGRRAYTELSRLQKYNTEFSAPKPGKRGGRNPKLNYARTYPK